MQIVSICMLFYPAIRRAVRPPPQNSAKTKKLGRESTARKSPIGSTNNQRGDESPR
ncbi:hypothetical protein CON07_11450 [Bacillus sp. AFS094611]|uniref:Spermidine/putrescine ABC transporter ATP-binding protein n=1 Tax=Bacillus anthracis TaxID=1392 RepID=A0A2A7D906_BACAN|nr:hypothetical protein CON16_15270 [Bacillus anthracis]PDZ51459.1 hypothetical protein CON07_11450 [Bacillus sp. AFS094611]